MGSTRRRHNDDRRGSILSENLFSDCNRTVPDPDGMVAVFHSGWTAFSTCCGCMQEDYIKEEQRNLKRELLRAQEEVKRIQCAPVVFVFGGGGGEGLGLSFHLMHLLYSYSQGPGGSQAHPVRPPSVSVLGEGRDPLPSLGLLCCTQPCVTAESQARWGRPRVRVSPAGFTASKPAPGVAVSRS